MSNIAEELVAIAENVPKVYEAGQKSMVDESKIIVKTAIGNPLTVDDVSEIPHTVSVQLTKKNLIPDEVLDFDSYTQVDTFAWTYPCELSVGNYLFGAEAKEAANDIGYFYLQRKSTDGSDDWTSYVQFIMNRAVIVANAFSVEEGDEYRFWVYSGTGVFPLDYFTGVRIEADVDISGVEVVIDGETVLTDAKGAVKGIKSVSPSMSLSSSAYFDISMTYHKSWGMQAEYDRFWDIYQDYGNRRNYQYFGAGYGWNDENFKPKYPVIVIDTGYMMFARTGIKHLDLSEYDFSKLTNFTYGFYLSDALESVVGFDCSGMRDLSNIFMSVTNLKTVEIKNLKPTCTYTNNFQNCSALENLTFANCEIGQSGIDLHWSTNLTAASLLSVLTALSKDSSVATGKNVVFATASQAVIEADAECTEQYNLAISAGWTIAFNS